MAEILILRFTNRALTFLYPFSLDLRVHHDSTIVSAIASPTPFPTHNGGRL